MRWRHARGGVGTIVITLAFLVATFNEDGAKEVIGVQSIGSYCSVRQLSLNNLLSSIYMRNAMGSHSIPNSVSLVVAILPPLHTGRSGPHRKPNCGEYFRGMMDLRSRLNGSHHRSDKSRENDGPPPGDSFASRWLVAATEVRNKNTSSE